VWIAPGSGTVIINRMPHVDYFHRLAHRGWLLEPFLATNTLGQFDVFAITKGGGLSGQAGAIKLGIARALLAFDPTLRPPLKKEGLLTRDPRRVERKKIGRKKARKGFTFVKR
jgi:small subunit ribosomal protein S9